MLYSHPNIWPEIPGFEKNIKELVKILVAVVLEVAAPCDRSLPHCSSLRETLEQSDVCRGRLLHKAQGDWCGEHLDHSCLTILTSAFWESPPADSEAGLYITARDGSIIKTDIPEDCVAIQSGSALELMTGGGL